MVIFRIMKRLILSVLGLMALCTLEAQYPKLPEDFINRLPAVPYPICDEDSAAHATFVHQFFPLDKELKDEILRRSKEMKGKVNDNQTKMEANALQQMGASPEISQKMMALQQKKKNATSQEERAAIDKEMKALGMQMMGEGREISMEEAKNMKNLSKEGKQAWATAYATGKKAEVTAEPEKYQQETAKNKEKMDLVNKYTRLNDSLGALKTRFDIRFRELDEDKDAIEALKRIEILEEDLRMLIKNFPYDTEKQESKMRQIYTEQENYCKRQTSSYVSILGDYEIFVRSSFLRYYRLEELDNQVRSMQTGVDLKPERGLMGLQVIEDYMFRLGDVYKYHIQNPNYDVDNPMRNGGAEGVSRD